MDVRCWAGERGRVGRAQRVPPRGNKSGSGGARCVRPTLLQIAIVAGVLGLSGLAANAAEIELRRECQPAGGIVTLGDVAAIHATDAQEAQTMAQAELFPSPPPGQQRYLRVRELQDLLLLRGIPIQQHRMSGSSQVTIRGAEIRASAGGEALSATMLKKAERQVSEAIMRCLQQSADGSQNWSVNVQLDDTQARIVTKALGNVSVRGGAAPWTGRQTFEVTAGAGSNAERFTVNVSVSVPLSVLVATHSMARGAVIGPTDVRLDSVSPNQPQGDCFHSAEEVIGSETTQAIAEGAVLSRPMLRTPLLVHRGEIVTVYARTGGISVRTTARVREDGGMGELVSVESLTERKGFIARVCGIRELEVFARAAQAESAARTSLPAQ